MDAQRDGRSATGADRSARQQAPPPTSRGRSRDGPADAEQAAFAVAEPGGAPAGRGGAGVVAFDGSDSVGRVQARQIVFLEGDPASPKFGDGRIEVIDFPRHLGVFARWGAGGLEEGEFTASAAVAQTPRGVPRLVAGQAGWRRSVVPAAGPAPGVGSRRRRARGLSRTESDSRCILHGRIRRCSTRPG
jgi:hypothetical protein